MSIGESSRAVGEHDARGAGSVFTPFTHFPQVEQQLESLFVERSPVSLPPVHARRFAQWLPWVCALFLPLHAVLALLAFGLLAFFGPGGWISGLLGLAVLGLDIVALPGLFKRTKQGWAFFTYAMALGVLRSLIDFSLFGMASSLLCVWLMFQAKQEYAGTLHAHPALR